MTINKKSKKAERQEFVRKEQSRINENLETLKAFEAKLQYKLNTKQRFALGVDVKMVCMSDAFLLEVMRKISIKHHGALLEAITEVYGEEYRECCLDDICYWCRHHHSCSDKHTECEIEQLEEAKKYCWRKGVYLCRGGF